MSLISRSIPGLFGGVSQQIPAMRHPTHCDLQENGVATLVEGLAKREGFEHIKSLVLSDTKFGTGASISGTDGVVFSHIIDRGLDGRYSLLVRNGNLMVHDLFTGSDKKVTFPDGKTYLNCSNPEVDFHAVSVADYTFLLNRTKTVATTGSFSQAKPINRGMVYVKQAVAAIDYKVTVDGVTATYTSDSTPTISEIVQGLVTELNIALPVGYTVAMVTPPNAAVGPVISIIRNSLAATVVAAADGYGNLACIAIHDSVIAYTDLPASLGTTTNFVCKISPNPSASRGAYYVLWDPTKLEYQECSSPGITDSLDPTTLPHKLVRQSDGSFIFSKITDWTKRKAGDDESNPMPSFVGGKINDIFFFRNRLGMLSQDSCALSKAGKYYTFFAESAQAQLDSDPIDLSNPTEQVVSLEWAVPFNEQLLLWSDKQQFALVGGDVLSPKSARMVPSTAFESYMGARPEPLGNKCVFACSAGDYSSVRMLKVSSDTITNQADDLTDHVPRYISKDLRLLRGSTTAKVIAAVSASGSLYLFKYEQDDDKEAMTQKSWAIQPWVDTASQTSKIIRVHWVDRRLYVIRFVKDSQDFVETGGRFMLERLDLQTDRTDEGASFSLRLDRKTLPASVVYSGSSTTVTVPYWERQPLVFLRCNPDAAPVVLTPTSLTFNTNGTMTAILPGNQSIYPVWIGRRFLFRYRFTEVLMRDSNQAPIQGAKLGLKHVKLKYVDTGFFKVKVTPYLRETYEYSFSGHVLGTIPLEGNQLATGEFNIPVHSRAEGTTIDIESDSFYPAVFPYAEWTANLVMKARR